eukprot:Nk52_evm91s224 gene=Nk52_evmTU91s224
MEEVDRIIFYSLAQLGCEWAQISGRDDDLQESVSIGGLSAEELIEGTAKCLSVIQKETVKASAPKDMSGKFRYCQDLARRCVDLGYPSDIGYHNFMYVSEKEARDLLMWLIERLPREDNQPENINVTDLDNAKDCARSAFGSWSVDPFVMDRFRLRGCNFDEYSYADMFSQGNRNLLGGSRKKISTVFEHSLEGLDGREKERERQYCEKFMRYPFDQVQNLSSHAFSILSHEALMTAEEDTACFYDINGPVEKEAKRKKAFENFRKRVYAASDENDGSGLVQTMLKMSVSEGEAGEVSGDKEEESDDLENELSQCFSSYEELLRVFAESDKEMRNINEMIEGNRKELQVLTLESESKEKEYGISKTAQDLLSNSEGDTHPLEDKIQLLRDDIEKLHAEWEEYRSTLMEKHDRLKDMVYELFRDTYEKLDDIKNFRTEIETIANEYQRKKETSGRIEDHLSKVGQFYPREKYTERILELVRNIKRQKEEVLKILGDTRDVQRQINSIQDTLGRSLAVTDELMYSYAKENASGVQAYKFLVTLKEKCEELVDAVRQSGLMARNVRELEQKIEAAEKESASLNHEKIDSDHQEIAKQNYMLAEKLKQFQSE